MPLTLPTHPIAVVPLKLWRPRWFDGVALTVGAIAPDLAYATDGYDLHVRTHNLLALLWWSLPVTLIAVRLIRWAAPAIAAHLPRGGVLALRAYGALGAARHRWPVTVISALLGAFSHLAWDSLTHPITPFPRLLHEVWPGKPWWGLISDVSDLTGFAIGAFLVIRIGRTGLIRRWHGPPPRITPRPVPFWCTAAVILAIGLIPLPFQPIQSFAVQAIGAMLTAGLALLGGAAVVTAIGSRADRRPAPTPAGTGYRTE